MSRKRKAPPGTYWRGKILFGRAKIRGRLLRWLLGTDDPAIAKARREAGKARALADVHGDARRAFEEVYTAWDVQLLRSVGPKTATRYLCSLKQLAVGSEDAYSARLTAASSPKLSANGRSGA